MRASTVLVIVGAYLTARMIVDWKLFVQDSTAQKMASSVRMRQAPEPAGCDPSYPTICIPQDSPDLDCDEVPYVAFKVVADDPHGFDADHDGIGCEPYPRR